MVSRVLTMPRLGETMDEGRIAGWLKQPGEAFARGEALLEIETDKTVAEFPALQSGRLTEILAQEGEMVAVGAPIARFEAEGGGEDAPAAAQSSAPAPAAAPRPEPAPPPRPAKGDAPAAPDPDAPDPALPDRKRATPLARRLARQRGVDLETLAGRGPRGRIEKDDVLAAARPGTADGPNPPRVVDLPQGRMAYAASGPQDGRTVLLLHGFSGDHTTWAATAGALSRAGLRVLAPDLPGHGATGIEAAAAADLGAPLADFLDALAAGTRVDVIAHSLGAAAAAPLALAAPERIASLTLLAPAGLGLEIDTAFVHGMAAARAPGEVAHLLRRIAVKDQTLSPAALDRIAAESRRGRLIALAEEVAGPHGQRVNLLPDLAEIAARLPVRVIFGLEDRILPWQQVAALPPAAAIHLLRGAGHMPHWDQPREVAALLSGWLARGA